MKSYSLESSTFCSGPLDFKIKQYSGFYSNFNNRRLIAFNGFLIISFFNVKSKISFPGYIFML